MGDALAVMDAGRIVQCASPRELWESPANVSVARFMGSGPCLPALGLERIAGKLVARTAAGSFVLPRETGSDVAGIEAATPAGPSHVFFGRSDASRLGASARENARESARVRAGNDPVKRGERVGGIFDALCVRADFAGDAVDCVMDSGGERFTLRFPANSAPVAGESAS